MDESGDEFFEVDKILDCHIDENDGKYRYRIRWKGFGPDHDTWEPKENLSLCTDLLKNFQKERKREKQLKKKRAEALRMEIKPEPSSEKEEDDGNKIEEDGDNDTEEESSSLMDGLTRSQKQQLKKVLDASKKDRISPTSSTDSNFENQFTNDSDIEIANRYKKKKRRVLESDTSDTSEETQNGNPKIQGKLTKISHSSSSEETIKERTNKSSAIRTKPSTTSSISSPSLLEQVKNKESIKEAMNNIYQVIHGQDPLSKPNINTSKEATKASKPATEKSNAPKEATKTSKSTTEKGSAPKENTKASKPATEKSNASKEATKTSKSTTEKGNAPKENTKTPKPATEKIKPDDKSSKNKSSSGKSSHPLPKTVTSLNNVSEISPGKENHLKNVEVPSKEDGMSKPFRIPRKQKNDVNSMDIDNPTLNQKSTTSSGNSVLPVENSSADNVFSVFSQIRLSQPSKPKPKDDKIVNKGPDTASKNQINQPSSNVDFTTEISSTKESTVSKPIESSNTSSTGNSNTSKTSKSKQKKTEAFNSNKAKKLSLKEYQAKKSRKRSSSSTDEGLFLEFTKVPNANQVTTTRTPAPLKTSKSIDNTTIIPPFPKLPLQSQISLDDRLPHEQLASNLDVLGNILQSFDQTPENPTTSSSNNPSTSQQEPTQVNEQDVNLQPHNDSEDIILEETTENDEDDGSEFDTDLEECSSDEEFVEHTMNINRSSHIDQPDANTVKMDQIVVNQCICAGDVDTLIKCDISTQMIDEYVDGEDTLLMKAVMECNPKIVKILLEKGSNPNMCSKNGKTPLMMAVELRQKKLAVMLIQHGAHLNMKTSDGRSALDVACSTGSIEIVHVLLSNGADVRPTMQSLDQSNVRVSQVPGHMKPALTSALRIQYDKLYEIVCRLMTDFVSSGNNKMYIEECLMPIRCISPKEMVGVGHTLYFDSSKVNVAEKHVNVLMIAVPVLFERNGQMVVKLEATNNNGVKEVIMNPETNTKGTNIQVIPGSNLLHILFPTIVGYNELLIHTDENSSYKILISVYKVAYGKAPVSQQKEPPAQRESTVSSTSNNQTSLQPTSVK